MSKRNIISKLQSEDYISDNESARSTKNEDVTKYYKGDILLREIGLLESALVGISWPMIIVVFIRIFIPTITDFSEQGWDFNLYWYEYLMKVMYAVVIILSYGVNLTFIYAGILDFRRKLFFMKILNSLISPTKDKDFVYSAYFPTLNM